MIMIMMMMAARFLLTVATSTYVVSASVLETTVTYFCQEGTQTLKPEHASQATGCEQSWTAGSIPIGSFISGSVECHHPCINVTAAEIIISGCTNVTLTAICYKGHVTEHRIHFQGMQIQPTPQQIGLQKRDHYGIWACLLLLLLIFVGFSIKYYLPQFPKIRSASENQHL